MRKRNPQRQLLKAYYNLLNGSIIYDGNILTVGTRIPGGQNNYIYIRISSVKDNSTGDGVLYNVIVTMEIVSLQEVNEGEDAIVNSILDQILSFIDDPDSILMDDFKCIMNRVEDMGSSGEEDESGYIVNGKLDMLNFIEQK